jgi:hypothetical protein
MTNTQRISLAVLGLSLLGTSIVALCGFTATEPYNASRPATQKTKLRHARAKLTAVPTCRFSTDEATAYCLFGKLTSANATWTPDNPGPQWTAWQGKCDIGLATPAACGPQTAAAQSDKHLLPADLVGGSRPVQTRVANSLKTATATDSLDEFASAGSIASVLYSPNIASVIHTKGYNRKIVAAPADPASPEPGGIPQISIAGASPSVITKLVWEVVVSGSINSPAFVYTPGVQTNVSAPHQLTAIANWPRYLIDGDETHPCPAGDLPAPTIGNSPTVPINCFFHYQIDTTDKAVMNALTGELKNEIETTVVPPNQHAFIIMVGAHMMSLDAAHPLWQWTTFYWMNTWNPATQNAATSGGLGTWKNPWAHYQMATTSIQKELAAGATQPVFNPYLEGHIDPNGNQTNCISCHSLAAYSPTRTMVTDAVTLIDGPRGNPRKGTPTYPESQNLALTPTPTSPHGYFGDAIRTHFLWSLATNPNLTPPAP